MDKFYCLAGLGNTSCVASAERSSLLTEFAFDAAGIRAIAAAFATTLFVLVFGVVFASRAEAQSAPVMAVPGQANVSQTGTFTYTIPIVAPPGTAGVMPNLSLIYSSQNGDGPEGLGWALGGLSSITRCPRTVAQDGVHGGVNYDSADRFCLDGQRLVVVTGTYGANNSEYRTEIETFSKIVLHTASGITGPAWFSVQTKSGLTLEFGHTNDSQVLAVGVTSPAVARMWAVNKVTDGSGNYYTVTYNPGSGANRTDFGQVYPLRIDYTGNDGSSPVLNTYNSIRFSYDDRTDQIPVYQAGSLIKPTVRLTDITTYSGTTVVSDYQLAYQTASSGASHNELTSVTRCDVHGVCLAPTTFGWQGSRDAPAITYGSATPAGINWAPGDYNGDGLTDLSVYSGITCPSGGSIYFGNLSGAFSSGHMTADYSYYKYHDATQYPYSGDACFPDPLGPDQSNVAGDLDGNGFSDLVIKGTRWVYYPPDGSWNPYPYSDTLQNNQAGHLSEVSSSTSSPYPLLLPTRPDLGLVFANDFNGDGRTDGYSAGDAYISDGDGTYTPDTTRPAPSSSLVLFGDFDGDGCGDMLGQGITNAVVYFCSPKTTPVTTPDWSADTLVLGDFNGDGKADVIVIKPTGTGELWLATGAGFVKTDYDVPTSWKNYTIDVGDFNGDGKTDLVLTSATATAMVELSTGVGFIHLADLGTINLKLVLADWNNDGASDILPAITIGNPILFGYVPELIKTIDNGIGAVTTVTYGRLNDTSIYTKGTGAAYPTEDFAGASYVVSKLASSNGVGGVYNLTYAYNGAKMDLSGRGFEGFKSVAITDPQTGVVQVTNYLASFPRTGLVDTRTVACASGTVVDSLANTYGATMTPGGKFVPLTEQVETRKDCNGTAMPTITTDLSDYDSYGNAGTVAVSLSDGATRTATNTYDNHATTWHIGQLSKSVVVAHIAGATDITRTTTYTYDATTGLLATRTIEPYSAPLTLETDLTRDDYGNVITTTVTDSAHSTPTPHTTNVAYNVSTYNAAFPTTVTNALSQASHSDFDPRFGTTTSARDLNAVETAWTYDDLGRAVTQTNANNFASVKTRTSWTYAYCSGVNSGTDTTCPTNGAYSVVTLTQGTDSSTKIAPQTRTYYDALARLIASDVQGFDGSWIRTKTQYDALGRVGQVTRPYFLSGGTAQWTVYSYLRPSGNQDPFGRVWKITLPDGSKTNFAYDGLQTTTTNDLGQVTVTTNNAEGLVASVKDAASKVTSYTYDGFSDLLTVTDPLSNQIANTYDRLGHKITSSDPDMGAWSYDYDTFGELTSQTDANAQTTALQYDLLYRAIKRLEPGLVSIWQYDTATHGIGLLDYVCTGPSCTATSNTSLRQFTYDGAERPTSVTLSTDGTNSFGYSYDYDSISARLAKVHYPSGFVALYTTNANGYLSTLSNSDASQMYWQANIRDAELHLVNQSQGSGITATRCFDAPSGNLLHIRGGSGVSPTSQLCNAGGAINLTYTWDTIGNLSTRADLLAADNWSEAATYDNRNRLKDAAITLGSGTYDKTVDYDQLGNITAKSDVGDYTYGESGAGPHAVTSIAGTVSGVLNPVFKYDANGNQTCMRAGAVTSACTNGTAARLVIYTSFNMASQIVQNATSTTTLNLTYDDRHARTSQVQVDTSGTQTTLYLNDPVSGVVVEKYTDTSGGAWWHDYLVADGTLVGERIKQIGGAGTETFSYFLSDALGSISTISGAVSEHLGYDAWGKRRNANGTADPSCAITSSTTRGFTQQEMMPPTCQINLNARIYDPVVARFMSADTMIPDPLNGQSFNRYSYVNNGPLSATDPSGHGDLKPPRHIVSTDGVCEGCILGGSRIPGGELFQGILGGESLGWIGGGIAGVAGGDSGIAYGQTGSAGGGNSGGYWEDSPGSWSETTSYDPIETITVTAFRWNWVSYSSMDFSEFWLKNSDPNGGWGDLWGTKQNPRPGQLVRNWLTGNGPSHYVFGPNSPNTIEMERAPQVNAARTYLYAKYNGSPSDGGFVHDWKGSFGIQGLLTSDTPTEQYVGSFRLDIDVANGEANYSLTNVSSFRSVAYGIGPSWDRSQFGPMGNMSQTYQWSEPIRAGGP